MSDIIQVNTVEAVNCISTCWRNKLVPMLHGSPGIGKSTIYHALAKKYKLWLIDIRLSQSDPVDLNGCITITDGRGSYAPMDFYPLDDAQLPEGYNGWLLLFDEINSAPNAVQAAAYKPILDRLIGQKPLHKMVFIAAAGNLITDAAIVNRIGTAMQSRLIHFELKVDHEPWAAWAASANLNTRIIGYINNQPNMLHQFDPLHNDKTFPCPRTWEFASRIISNNSYPELNLPLLSGTVGRGAANSYLIYEEVYKDLPTVKQIEQAPDTIKITSEPAALAALSSMVGAHMNVNNAKRLMKWVMRISFEFQTFCLRDAINRTPAVYEIPEIEAWAVRNAKVLA